MKNLIISFCFLTISLIVSGQSGNVGIGTTAPADKLHVMGGFIAEETMIIMESDAPPVFTMGSASSSSDSSAVLYDSGGPSGDYSNNENYSFLINYIQGAHAVQLSVDSMYTESPYDKLILTWGDGRSDILSGTPTGLFRGQFPVTIDFETNEVNTDMGFKISWNGLAFPSGDTADIEGPGVRVQWLPGKRAFRVGSVTGSQWDFENIGYSSFAQGYSNIASGPLSVAMGSWNISSGYSSFVLGSNSKATENYATAIGSNTTASNYYTLATGATTRASAYGSTTFGFNTDAEAYLGVALGKYNVGGGNPDS